MKVETELEGLLGENIRTTRVTNALLLAQSMGIKDITLAQETQRVLRHLELIEGWVNPNA